MLINLINLILTGDEFFQNSSMSLDCDQDPAKKWKFGPHVISMMKNVNYNTIYKSDNIIK